MVLKFVPHLIYDNSIFTCPKCNAFVEKAPFYFIRVYFSDKGTNTSEVEVLCSAEAKDSCRNCGESRPIIYYTEWRARKIIETIIETEEYKTGKLNVTVAKIN